MPAAVERGGIGATLRCAPNLVTLARLGAVPAVTWLILHGRLGEACILFALTGLSDALDGWLARRLGASTPLGAALDPLADKALLMSVYTALAVIGLLPAWLAVLVVARDLLILGGVLWLAWRGPAPPIRPLPVSRVNTAVQIIVAGFALGSAALAWPVEPMLSAGIWLVAATTLGSGLGTLHRAWAELPA